MVSCETLFRLIWQLYPYPHKGLTFCFNFVKIKNYIKSQDFEFGALSYGVALYKHWIVCSNKRLSERFLYFKALSN